MSPLGSRPGLNEEFNSHATTPSVTPSHIPAVRESRLRRVLEIIDVRPSCSVRELAMEVRLTPAHLQRLFKQEVGSHIRDLIAERRLQNAAQLLLASDMSIKEIAYQVGYEHHSSFVRAFQRRFAQAPRYYRRQCSAKT